MVEDKLFEISVVNEEFFELGVTDDILFELNVVDDILSGLNVVDGIFFEPVVDNDKLSELDAAGNKLQPVPMIVTKIADIRIDINFLIFILTISRDSTKAYL